MNSACFLCAILCSLAQADVTSPSDGVVPQVLASASSPTFGDSLALSSNGHVLVVGDVSSNDAYLYSDIASLGSSFAIASLGLKTGVTSPPTAATVFGASVSVAYSVPLGAYVVAVGVTDATALTPSTAQGYIAILTYDSATTTSATACPVAAMVTNSGGTSTDGFGYAIGLSGDASTLVSGGGKQGDGQVSIFRYINGAWVQKEAGSHAGYARSVSLSLDGSVIAWGDYSFANGAGFVVIIQEATAASNTWGCIPASFELAISAGENFAASISMSSDGSKLIAGSMSDGVPDVNSNTAGISFLLESVLGGQSCSVWSQTIAFDSIPLSQPPVYATGSLQGYGVALAALHPDRMVVTAPAYAPAPYDSRPGSIFLVSQFGGISNATLEEWYQADYYNEGCPYPGQARSFKTVSMSDDGLTIAAQASTCVSTNLGQVNVYRNFTGWPIPPPSPSSTVTPTASATAATVIAGTSTPTATISASATVTPTGSLTPSPSLAASLSSALTSTPTPTPTVSYTASATVTGSPTPSSSSSPSASDSPAASSGASSAASASVSSTATQSAASSTTSSATPSFSQTQSPSSSATGSSSLTRSRSFSRTASAHSSVTASATPSATPSVSPTPTSSASAGAIPVSPSETETRSSSRSASKSVSHSPSPSSSATASSSVTPTSSTTGVATPTHSASTAASQTRTASRSRSVSGSRSPSKVPSKTVSGTHSVSATSSATPSASASATPSASEPGSSSATKSAYASASETPSETTSASPSSSCTSSASPSYSLSPSTTITTSPTETGSESPTQSATASVSTTPSMTLAVTFTRSLTPSKMSSRSPSPSASRVVIAASTSFTWTPEIIAGVSIGSVSFVWLIICAVILCYCLRTPPAPPLPKSIKPRNPEEVVLEMPAAVARNIYGRRLLAEVLPHLQAQHQRQQQVVLAQGRNSPRLLDTYRSNPLAEAVQAQSQRLHSASRGGRRPAAHYEDEEGYTDEYEDEGEGEDAQWMEEEEEEEALRMEMEAEEEERRRRRRRRQKKLREAEKAAASRVASPVTTPAHLRIPQPRLTITPRLFASYNAALSSGKLAAIMAAGAPSRAAASSSPSRKSPAAAVSSSRGGGGGGQEQRRGRSTTPKTPFEPVQRNAISYRPTPRRQEYDDESPPTKRVAGWGHPDEEDDGLDFGVEDRPAPGRSSTPGAPGRGSPRQQHKPRR